jgi:hypothetical protein
VIGGKVVEATTKLFKKLGVINEKFCILVGKKKSPSPVRMVFTG